MNTSASSRQSNTRSLLEGSLWDKIILFAIPLAISSMLQQLFNAADTAVAGRFADSNALAAVGANAQAIGLLINLFVGMSVGANVVVAESIGRKEEGSIRAAVKTTITLSLLCGAALVLIGQFLAPPLLRLIHTPEEILDQAVLYLRLYFLGMPFIMVYNFGSAIIRSKGDSRRPGHHLLAFQRLYPGGHQQLRRQGGGRLRLRFEL